VLDGRKSVYGQAFAIYALCAYARAAHSEEAAAWAERSFDLLEARAADGKLGFREEFGPAWAPGPGSGDQKTLNTHLHLVEALMTLVEVSRRERYVAVLGQLVDLLVMRVIHPRRRHAWDEFDRQWRPRTVWRRRIRILYGHEVELAWLLLDAMDRLGQPRARVQEAALGLIDHALAYGFDGARGGLAAYGPPLGSVRHAVYLPRARLVKHWWQQAEMLVATLEAYRETGRRRYLAAFEKQFEWIWRHQIDHEAGDWFESTTWREGTPLRLIKGHDWKDPYHNARALMEVSRRLRALGIGAP
jgi:mannose/cellobiose epimerase-like protein (N-acyl-D-glucosamine 2-epimerase family)